MDHKPRRPTITDEEALQFHQRGKPGKLEITPTKPMATQRDLSLAYSPGVAYACLAIQKDPSMAAEYTSRANLVGVVTHGTAELGLVNIGPLEGGKATNIVADRARAWGNARFRDEAREQSLKQGLFALATAPDAPLPRTRIEYESNRPAKPETAAVRAMAGEVRAIGEALGQREVAPFPASSGVGFGKVRRHRVVNLSADFPRREVPLQFLSP